MPNTNFLSGARTYLSGPMDFVSSRDDEAKRGWRTRVSQFLREQNCVVFDPWNKPRVRGMANYGREGIDTTSDLNRWTYEQSLEGAKVRNEVTSKYKQTTHIDLRAVDTCDLLIARCPTNVYSVGTPHEIVLARSQHKPVFIVSPPVRFPAYNELKQHLSSDAHATFLLEKLAKEVSLKDNPRGIPSLWYMSIVGSENFFDGFGYSAFRDQFGWERTSEDDLEDENPPVRPLLPYLLTLKTTLPKKWTQNGFVVNDDFLLWSRQK